MDGRGAASTVYMLLSGDQIERVFAAVFYFLLYFFYYFKYYVFLYKTWGLNDKCWFNFSDPVSDRRIN